MAFVMRFAAILSLLSVVGVLSNLGAGDVIDYRGMKIKLTRHYSDYDDYKNDPENIAVSELPRIEAAIREAKFDEEYEDWASFAKQMFELKVPGYGVGAGFRIEPAGSPLIVKSVEIPARPPVTKGRFFVLEKPDDGRLRLIDDFCVPDVPIVSLVRMVDGKLEYLDYTGKVVREKVLKKTAEPGATDNPDDAQRSREDH